MTSKLTNILINQAKTQIDIAQEIITFLEHLLGKLKQEGMPSNKIYCLSLFINQPDLNYGSVKTHWQQYRDQGME